jgi:AcrR family transcriptional regulator
MATKKSTKAGAGCVIENVRDRILATARNLIYCEGARAVGVDRIVAESGVAKMSLYRWFPSKDDLIAEVLREEQRRILKVWDDNIARHAGDPLAQLRAQFDSLAAAIGGPNYRGCAFLNAAMAFADESHPARAVVLEFKNELTKRFLGLTTAIGAKDPKALAQQLSLIADGAHASGQAVGKTGPCTQMRSVVDALIEAQLPKKY